MKKTCPSCGDGNKKKYARCPLCGYPWKAMEDFIESLSLDEPLSNVYSAGGAIDHIIGKMP